MPRWNNFYSNNGLPELQESKNKKDILEGRKTQVERNSAFSCWNRFLEEQTELGE